jgi:hypothetical protein
MKFLSREASASSRLNEKSSHYDIIVAGGGMVGTTLVCALGWRSFIFSYV